MHPSVERGCPFFAAGAGLNPHGVRDFLNRIAETYFFIFDETGKAHAMRLAFNSTHRFFLFLGVRGFLNSVGSDRLGGRTSLGDQYSRPQKVPCRQAALLKWEQLAPLAPGSSRIFGF